MTVGKKCRVAILASALVAGLLVPGMYSAADSAFDLFNTYGVYLADAVTPMLANSLVQLVWTLDNAYHPAVLGKLDDAGYLLSGDYILFEGGSPTALAWGGDLDGNTNYTGSDVGGATLPSGYVYARVFNIAYGSSPTGMTAYMQTVRIPVTHNVTSQPPTAAQTVDVAPGTGAGPAGGEVMSLTVAIPEPISLAMFGVGMVSIVMWRLRKR